MKTWKCALFVLALAMVGTTSAILIKIRGNQVFGQPGVAVGPIPICDTNGHIVATHSVILPVQIPGTISAPQPITASELNTLPRDTTFGRRAYRTEDGFQAVLSVVLMGSDRTSIHQPQYCLVGQGWTLDKTELISLHIDRPVAYGMPALKITASNWYKDAGGKPEIMSGIYVYWFVTKDKITADPFSGMMWSMAKTFLQKKVLERWAYISYFTVCPPGSEQAAFDRLEKLIQASVPEFQLVTGTQSPVPDRH